MEGEREVEWETAGKGRATGGVIELFFGGEEAGRDILLDEALSEWLSLRLRFSPRGKEDEGGGEKDEEEKRGGEEGVRVEEEEEEELVQEDGEDGEEVVVEEDDDAEEGTLLEGLPAGDLQLFLLPRGGDEREGEGPCPSTASFSSCFCSTASSTLTPTGFSPSVGLETSMASCSQRSGLGEMDTWAMLRVITLASFCPLAIRLLETR